MQVPPAPPPLSLARVQRLLRPLRASLSALSTALAQHHSRTTAASALARPALRESKPRSRNSLDNDDEEYAEGRRRKKRRTGTRATAGKAAGATQAGKHPVSSSSPFVARTVDLFTEEDGGSRRTSGGSTGTEATTLSVAGPSRAPASASAPRAGSGSGFNLVRHLSARGYARDVIKPCMQLANAFLTILEALYPPPPIIFKPTKKHAAATASSTAAREAPPPPPPTARAVPTLGELCARQIGWGIEENVRLCLEQVAGAREEAEQEVLERERAQRGRRESNSTRQSTRTETRHAALSRAVAHDEDAGFFQNEWYEACPAHAVR